MHLWLKVLSAHAYVLISVGLILGTYATLKAGKQNLHRQFKDKCGGRDAASTNNIHYPLGVGFTLNLAMKRPLVRMLSS
jgi:hypothetical protein